MNKSLDKKYVAAAAVAPFALRATGKVIKSVPKVLALPFKPLGFFAREFGKNLKDEMPQVSKRIQNSTMRHIDKKITDWIFKESPKKPIALLPPPKNPSLKQKVYEAKYKVQDWLKRPIL